MLTAPGCRSRTGSAAATPKLLQLADFGGERCWIGMDLAEKRDFAALALVFKRSERFYLFTRLYLNELAISEVRQRAPAGLGARRLRDGHRRQCHRLRRDRRRPAQLLQAVPGRGDPLRPAMSRYFATKLSEKACRWSRSAGRRCSSRSR